MIEPPTGLQWRTITRGVGYGKVQLDHPYGRSPAVDALPDMQAHMEITRFWMERVACNLEPVPCGVTIYRDPAAKTWRPLPAVGDMRL